jgi:shikimate 5-dehydrogenase
VHARDAGKATAIAKLAGGIVGPWPPLPGSWDIAVNCTPLGMHPYEGTTPLTFGPAFRPDGQVVYDLVYNPTETRLLREAAAAGCDTIGGLDMLVGQAIAQFAWWTGVRPAAAPMRDAALKRLSEFADR